MGGKSVRKSRFSGKLVAACLVLFSACVVAGFNGPAPVAIVEYADGYTKVAGLGTLLNDVGQPYIDLSAQAVSGSLDLSRARVLMLGSFVTNSPDLKRLIAANARALQDFVYKGGVLVVLTQADQDERQVEWLPPGLSAIRSDVDYEYVTLLSPEHPLFNSPNRVVERGAWQSLLSVPVSAWESLESQSGFAVLAASDRRGARPCILEGTLGQGRILLVTMALDKWYSQPGQEFRRAGILALTQNLVSYVDQALAGRGLLVQPTPPYQPLTLHVKGRVLADFDGNGRISMGDVPLAGVALSDGNHVVTTGALGYYALDTSDDVEPIVYVTVPSGYSAVESFYAYLPSEPNPVADFLLRPDPATARDGFTFAQISDIHVFDAQTREHFTQGLREIQELDETPAFVVATGDLVDSASARGQLQQYAQALASTQIPVRNVIGNHDAGGGGPNYSGFYRHFLGPDHYSWDYGSYHFVAVNCLPGFEVERPWLEQDLAAVRGKKHLVVFYHYDPTRELMDFLAERGGSLLAHGHWHSTKVGHYRDVLYVSTSSFRWGGIDSSPVNFRIVRCGPNGQVSTEMRVREQHHLLAVVSPEQETTAWDDGVLFLVNAADTSTPPRQVELVVADRTDNAPPGAGWQRLEQGGPMTWSLKMPLEPGRWYRAWVRAVPARGDTWQTSHLFFVRSQTLLPRPTGDWPHYRGPAHDGAASSLRPPLRLAWVCPTGRSLHMASPVVVNGTVFLGTQDDDNGTQASVIALDATTGAVRWKHPVDSSIKDAVTAAQDSVFAMTVTETIYALDARTGEEQWKAQLGDILDRWAYGSPTVQDGVVYAGPAGKLAALDAATGKVLWTAALAGDWVPSHSSPLVADDRLIVAYQWSKGVAAVSRADGSLLWSVEMNANATAVRYGDQVIVAAGGGLVALDLKTGEKKWTLPIPQGWPTSSPALKDGVVYVGLPTGDIIAARADTGELVWRTPTARSLTTASPYLWQTATVASSPAVAGEVVYVGANDGCLYGLNTSDGRVIWKCYFGAMVSSSPAVSGNCLYVADDAGNLYCFVGEAK